MWHGRPFRRRRPPPRSSWIGIRHHFMPYYACRRQGGRSSERSRTTTIDDYTAIVLRDRTATIARLFNPLAAKLLFDPWKFQAHVVAQEANDAIDPQATSPSAKNGLTGLRRRLPLLTAGPAARSESAHLDARAR